MKQFTLYLEDELACNVDNYKRVRRTKNSSQALREILYSFFDENTDKSVDFRCSRHSNIMEDLTTQASDLPGMTPEVIQSHLVRFPKVSPEAYKGIIEELRARQNSEEGLKNPEAAAYGLCKRIQNGQPRTGSTPQEQHQAQPATVPEDNPFAIYEP